DSSPSAWPMACTMAAMVRRSIRLLSSGRFSRTVSTPSARLERTGCSVVIWVIRSGGQGVELVIDRVLRQQGRIEGDDLLDAALVDGTAPGAAGRSVARQLRGEILDLARLLQGHEARRDTQFDLAHLAGVDPPVEQRVDADIVEPHVLVLDAAPLAQLQAHDLRRLLRFLVAPGAAIDDAAHAHVALAHGERDAGLGTSRMAGRPLDTHPVRSLLAHRRRREVDDAAGVAIIVRVADLVEQLLLAGLLVDHAARAGKLGDHGTAAFLDLHD